MLPGNRGHDRDSREACRLSNVRDRMDSTVDTFQHESQQQAAEDSSNQARSQIQITMRAGRAIQHSSAVDDAYIAGLGGSRDTGFLDLGVERIVKLGIGLGFLLELIVLSHFV